MARLLQRVSPQDQRFAFWLALVGYAAFSLLDWATTAIALANGGREGNPLARSLYLLYGSAGLLAFKAAVVTVIIAALVLIPRRVMSERVATWVAVAFTVAVAVTSVHNIQVLTALQQGGLPGSGARVQLL